MRKQQEETEPSQDEESEDPDEPDEGQSGEEMVIESEEKDSEEDARDALTVQELPLSPVIVESASDMDKVNTTHTYSDATIRISFPHQTFDILDLKVAVAMQPVLLSEALTSQSKEIELQEEPSSSKEQVEEEEQEEK